MMFCENCGTKRNDNAVYCKNCGAAFEAQPAAPVPPHPQQPMTTHAGYSPVADTPEFRRLAALKNRKNVKKSKTFMATVCVVVVLYIAAVVGFGEYLGFSDADKLPMIALGCGVAIITVFFNIKRNASNNRPPVEMIAEKYESHSEGNYMGAGEYSAGYQSLNVVFKDEAGRTASFGANDERVQEYYQIGDRCLYHRDIEFFEKYDKGRDTFSLCPFCTMKVELGKTRCTYCNKPMLV